ncbi:MAG: hypothetical protein HYX86_00645 [Chloroflexi bacterium]|nr:hypothetical protein [Chloroflexota bacterium]
MSNRPAGYFRLIPLALLQRKRILTLPGEVLVQAGEEVEAGRVIVQAEIAQRPLLLPVARALSLPDEELALLLRKKVGEDVERGETLAQKRSGLPWGRIYSSPAAGKVVSQTRGRILLDLAPSSTQVLAGFSGRAVEVIPERGAILETQGAVIEGRWGSGGETSGLLKVVSEAKGGPLFPEHLDSRFSEAIVVGDTWAEKETLSKAAEVGVRGMILGSIPASLLGKNSAIPFPLMLTEGFGKMAMLPPMAHLLERHTWQEAFLSAIPPRPQLIISLPRQEEAVEEKTVTFVLDRGQQLRIGGGEKRGQVGFVSDPSPRWQRLESGLGAWCVEVVVEEEERVWVPLANLEVLG